MKKNVMHLAVIALMSSCVGALAPLTAGPVFVQGQSSATNFVGVSTSGSTNSKQSFLPAIDPISVAQTNLNNALMAQKSASMAVERLVVADDAMRAKMASQPKALAAAQKVASDAQAVLAAAKADLDKANARLSSVPSLADMKISLTDLDKKIASAKDTVAAADAKVKIAQMALDKSRSDAVKMDSSDGMLSGHGSLSTKMTTTPAEPDSSLGTK